MYNPIPLRERPLVAQRINYIAGYTEYFYDGVQRLLRLGYTVEEMKAYAVDDTMRKWIDSALPKVQKGNP